MLPQEVMERISKAIDGRVFDESRQIKKTFKVIISQQSAKSLLHSGSTLIKIGEAAETSFGKLLDQVSTDISNTVINFDVELNDENLQSALETYKAWAASLRTQTIQRIGADIQAVNVPASAREEILKSYSDVSARLIDRTFNDLEMHLLSEKRIKSNESQKPKTSMANERIVIKGYVFIAMPMTGGKPEYDDVHDVIKEAAELCDLHAERVDEMQNNERITDNLLAAIRRSEYVVVDLTDSRPNVFYEAGYAFGLGITPIYIAKEGTKLEFDLNDYPVIFFQNMRSLREGLVKRLTSLKTK